VELVECALEGRLSRASIRWSPRHAVTVVAASAGYPGKYASGHPIRGLGSATDEDTRVFHAGTKLGPSGEIVTSGGRVLAVTALGEDRARAREKAYRALAGISFDGMQHRRDVGSPGR
jgi:phosphoribosylamine--glycine ligase